MFSIEERRFDFLKESFQNYEVRISSDGSKAVIVNPFWDEDLTVYYYEEDDFTPYVASFSFQHCHLMDEEDVIDWINDFISGRKLAIEFFQNGMRRFGGDIESGEMENISYQNLKQHTGYYGLTDLLKVADSFKVRGWNPESNFDASLEYETDGNVMISKTVE